jgi:hypothetical protein
MVPALPEYGTVSLAVSGQIGWLPQHLSHLAPGIRPVRDLPS